MSDYDAALDSRLGYEVGIAEIRRRKIAAGEIVPWVRREMIGDATLYLADCREMAPGPHEVDALISDPPYGVGERTNRKSNGRGTGGVRLQGGPAGSRDWSPIFGDDQPFDPSPWLQYRKVVMFGANHYCDRLPGSSCWLVWDKREETTPDDNADCEMAWTNLRGPARIHRQLWRGICRRGEENIATGTARLHPTQKPIALMDRAIELCRLQSSDVVLDPYMGAGPTGVAAVRRGLRFIGIEIDPGYFDIACRRVEEAYRSPDLFIEHAKREKAEAVDLFAEASP